MSRRQWKRSTMMILKTLLRKYSMSLITTLMILKWCVTSSSISKRPWLPLSWWTTRWICENRGMQWLRITSKLSRTLKKESMINLARERRLLWCVSSCFSGPPSMIVSLFCSKVYTLASFWPRRAITQRKKTSLPSWRDCNTSYVHTARLLVNQAF